jgi:hypothetical protein
MMETVPSSETSMDFYLIKQRHIPEDNNLESSLSSWKLGCGLNGLFTFADETLARCDQGSRETVG